MTARRSPPPFAWIIDESSEMEREEREMATAAACLAICDAYWQCGAPASVARRSIARVCDAVAFRTNSPFIFTIKSPTRIRLSIAIARFAAIDVTAAPLMPLSTSASSVTPRIDIYMMRDWIIFVKKKPLVKAKTDT